MNITSIKVDFQRREAVHRQIADQLRELIRSGQIAAGIRLPSTLQLAAAWQTHVATVHLALSALTQEGLLERSQRKGTFVRGASTTLGSVAIYLGHEIMGPRHMEYLRLVYAELTRRLKAEGIAYEPLLDPRPDEEEERPWDLLVKALEKRKYQAVIALGAKHVRMKWLEKLGVPLASLAGIGMRFDEFAEKCARALKEQNCRSAGLIANFSKDSTMAGQIKDAVGQNAMEFRDDWHIYPAGKFLPGPEMERFGHDGFLKIWSRPERPEGLIVFPNTALAGVAAALVKQKVRIPDKLKLVVHMNKGSEISFPFEATRIVFDPAESAAAVLRQLRRKLAGEAPAPEEIGFSVMRGGSA